MAYKSNYHPRLCDCHECWEQIYPSIREKSNQFRLLAIDEQGNGILEAFDLDDPPPYSALSYAWRETTDLAKEADHCLMTINGHVRQISYNLWSFLEHQCTNAEVNQPKVNTIKRHRRSISNTSDDKSKTFYIWVDSICIDQKSLYELNHQVALMKQIYSKASRVLVWLGDTDPKVRPLFTALDLEEHTLSQKISGRKEYDPYNQWDVYNGVLALFERRYWTRVWIVQEFLLNTELTICCGIYAIPFELLYRLCCGLDDQSKSKYDGTLISPLTPPSAVEGEFGTISLPHRSGTYSTSSRKPNMTFPGTRDDPRPLTRASTTSTLASMQSTTPLFSDPDVSAASNQLQTLPTFRSHPGPLLLRSRARRRLDLARLIGTSAPLKIYLESFFPAVANGRQCSDPRDRVYAILGLVADEDLKADYHKSLEQVFLMLVGRRSVRNVSRIGRMALAVLRPNEDAFASTDVHSEDEDQREMVTLNRPVKGISQTTISTRIYFNNTSHTTKFDIAHNRDPEMQVLEFCDCIGVHRREREKPRYTEGFNNQSSSRAYQSFNANAKRASTAIGSSNAKTSSHALLPSSRSGSNLSKSEPQTACPHATGWMCVTNGDVQPTDLAYWYPDSSLVLFVRHPPLAMNENTSSSYNNSLTHVLSNPESTGQIKEQNRGYIGVGFVIHSTKISSFLRIHRKWPSNFTNLFNNASSVFGNTEIRFKSMRDANADGGWSLEAIISPAALLFLLNQCEKDPLDAKETISEMMIAGEERWGSRKLLWDGLRFPRPTTLSDDASGRSSSPSLSGSTRRTSATPKSPPVTNIDSSRSNSRGLRQSTLDRLGQGVQDMKLDTRMTETPPPMQDAEEYFSPMKATYVPTFNSEPDFMTGVNWDDDDEDKDEQIVMSSHISRV